MEVVAAMIVLSHQEAVVAPEVMVEEEERAVQPTPTSFGSRCSASMNKVKHVLSL
jgi:hypothetical protein